MKSDFKFIEDEMNSLSESMVDIRRYTNEIDQDLRETRLAIRRLTNTSENLKRVCEFLYHNELLVCIARVLVIFTFKVT